MPMDATSFSAAIRVAASSDKKLLKLLNCDITKDQRAMVWGAVARLAEKRKAAREKAHAKIGSKKRLQKMLTKLKPKGSAPPHETGRGPLVNHAIDTDHWANK